MYFSYEQGSLANLYPLPASRVREILAENRKGNKPASLQENGPAVKSEFISAVGDESITRFDEQKKRRGGNNRRRGGRNNGNRNNDGGERRHDNRPRRGNDGNNGKQA
jgi:hypothetical protein